MTFVLKSQALEIKLHNYYGLQIYFRGVRGTFCWL